MLGLGPIHLILLVLVIVLLFGAGRVSGMMGELGKGIKSFKSGLKDHEEEPATPQPGEPARRITDERTIEHPVTPGSTVTGTGSVSGAAVPPAAPIAPRTSDPERR